MKLRAQGGVVILLCAAVACGCGDESQEPLVRGVMHRYLVAIADGRSARACAVMTATGRGEVVRLVNSLVPKLHASSCRQALTGLAEQLDRRQTRLLRTADIEIDLHGDRAVARPVDGTSSAVLRNVGDRWLIDRVQF